MVRLQYALLCTIAIAFTVILPIAESQTLEYHLEHEWAKIWINQDGTIDLLYDITIVCEQGTLHWVEVGQPNDDFEIGQAYDENNNQLSTEDTSSSGQYKVRVDVRDLEAGESIRFNLTTNVGKMIREDDQNPGNVGMRFTPTWFPVVINNLRVRVVAPLGVNQSNLKTLEGVPWDNAEPEDGGFAVYWERDNLVPNQKYTFGVSFPQEFVQHYEPQTNLLLSLAPWIAVIIAICFVVLVVAVAFRKRDYLKPIISVETLGIKRGLTAVEASYLLDMKPNMIVTEILFSLLKKRAVWVTSTEPSVKLRTLAPFADRNAKGIAEGSLRYYEIDFLSAINKDGALDEEKLAETIIYLGRAVEEKLRGYCRRDTVSYYKKVVEDAWRQVESAGTSELASKAYDEQLLWLFLDPRHRSKTEAAFKDRLFEPATLWFWYWYSYQQYHPRPTYKPSIDRPAPEPPPKIPGSDFANNMAAAVENTSNNIVANLEKFANAIIPASQPSRTSHRPAHQRSSCVCACAACACACACVSCACACAGGGAG